MHQKRPSRSSLPMLAITFAIASPNLYAYDDEITLFLQALEGPKAFSVNVTTIIELQLMRTLRSSGGNNGNNEHFGKGRIFRNKEELPIRGFTEADTIAINGNNKNPQGILWGKSWLFPDGVAVQTYLSLPSYEDYRSRRFEEWRISLIGIDSEFEFFVDAPSRRYELPVIVVPMSIVERYSTPDGMPIYSNLTRSKIISYLGSNGSYEFKALEHQGEFTKIKSDGFVGWLYLPALSQTNSELVDFVSGVIRVFRSDYSGAIENFSSLTESSTSMYIRLDALLFSVMAKAKLGRSCHSTAESALQLNPYSTTSVKYLIMCYLEELKAEKSLARRKSLVRKISTTVSRFSQLFSKDDAWIINVNKLLSAIKSNPSMLISLRGCIKTKPIGCADHREAHPTILNPLT